MGKRATLDQLAKKRAFEKTVVVKVPSDDGEEEDVELRFRAIGHKEYDRLITKFPPSAQQKRDGLTYDPDRFGPALFSKVCIDPVLSLEDAEEIWKSEDWNRGEITNLFLAAIDVCTHGSEVGPTEGD